MRSLRKQSNSLSFFTDPYPDELLYSAFARYHFYSGNIDLKDTLTELFGKNSVIPSFEIGSHLGFLCRALGGTYTPERLIQKHTLFPFYTPFLPTERKEELLRDIKSSDGKAIYTKIGIVAGSICRKDSIYYCSACAKEEIELLGEAYIHREHQLQGVIMCPKHELGLKIYPISKHENSRIKYIRLDSELLDLFDVYLCKDRFKDEMIRISKAAYYLLSNDLGHVTKADVLQRYKNLLYEQDLATTRLRVKQYELYDRVIDYYGTELLETLESGLDKNDEYNWLSVATRNVSRTVHPLRHILLILFLTGDMNAFFKGIHETYNPFGKGPWPCLNKASDHYQQSVITQLTITADYKTREPVGTFICGCGYIFSRKGPDKSEKDRFRIGSVKAFGIVWINKLRRLLNERCHSYREMARQLGCDIKTIHKFESFLKENNSIEHENDKTNQKTSKDQVSKHRERLLYTIKENPELPRTDIRSLCQKEYTYLYRNDREWLFETLPTRIPQKGSQGYVDWGKRDDEVLSQLKKARTDLLRSVKPVRICKASLRKAITNPSWLEKHLHKLPGCGEFITKVSESKQQFQLRRCQIIVNKMREEGLPLIEWKIQREAGLRKKDYEMIRDKLELEMHEDGVLRYG